MYALIDCNSFYASCEEVFNPKLKNLPLLILSNNDGCVIACSKKAKDLQVKVGDPAYLYKEQMRRGELRMLSSNFTLYADMSNRVMQTIESFGPEMEIYSIDEAFFQMEDLPTLREKALSLRQKVKKWTGIPISIGIAPTKTLAKLANHVAKKESVYDGVRALSLQDIPPLLDKTAPGEIWGIGKASADRLKRKRIYTAGELSRTEDRTIQSILGVGGLRTVFELRGIPCFPYEETPEKRQSILCSRSFGHRVTDKASLEEAVSSFATRAAEKLRSQDSLASFLSVSIATAAFESHSCHIDLPNPTAFTPEFIRLAKEGLGKIYRPEVEYRKAGVLLSHFSDKGSQQIDWLSPSVENPKKAELMRTIDQINDRYEKGAIRFASEGTDQDWRSVSENASPRFTTSWDELLKIPDLA